MKNKITILIPSAGINAEKSLYPALESVFLNTDFQTNFVEILVVMNGYKEKEKWLSFTKRMIKQGMSLKFLWEDDPLGYVKAINLGLEEILKQEEQPSYVCFLNDDILIHSKEWLNLLLSPFKHDNKMGIVGAKSLPCPITGIDFPLGYCVLIKTEVIKKIGMLDQIFGLGFNDDVDFCLRALRAEYHVYSYINGFDRKLHKSVGQFPVSHFAENTMHSGELFSIEDWHKHTAKNRQILAERYWEVVHVILPTYCRCSKLEKTLDSLLAQHYSKLVIHVVADGHNEKVEKIVATMSPAFAAKGMVIEYTYVEHEGLYGSRPRMSVLAALPDVYDQWCVFIDDDNIVYPDYVLKLWQATFAARLAGGEAGGAWCRIFHREAGRDIPGPEFRKYPVWQEIDSLSYMVRTDIAKKHFIQWQHIKGEKVVHDYNFAKACFDEAPWVFVDKVLACHGQPTSILVQAVCYNEEKLIPFFLRHYEQIADKIIVYDGGSTDRSVELLKQSPKVEVVTLDKEDGKMHNIDLMRIRNEAWKEYRYDYEWVIVCDMDEFLYHPDLKNKLENFRKKLCVSIPRVEGYQMFAEDFPENDGSQIYEKVGRGFADPEHLNKFMIFSPKGVDINYDPGCHTAQPTGDVHYSADEDKLYLLHYKYVGYDYFIDKNKALAARVGDDDKERHWAFHYEQDAKMTKEEFMKFAEKTRQIVGNEKRIPVDWEAMRRESDYIYYEIMHENQYQVKKEDFIGKNVIDVGGNTGIFSLLAYESGAEKIVVVEPNPETLKLLHKNTEDKKEITILEKAVGLSDDGFVEMCKWDDWTPIDGKCYTKNADQGVGTVTLDTLVKTVGDNRPILLKVDCEGGEYDLFYGASLEALSKINTIVIEMHQDVPGREGQKNLIEPLRHFITSLGFKEKFAWEYVPKKVWIFRFDRILQTYKPDRKNIEVTVGIPTKNRYYSTLPITLLSVITQTHKPKKIIIVDDSDTEKDGKMKDLRNDPMYQYFFPMLAKKGIEWEVVFGPKKGQHHSHQIILDKAKTEFVWRLDDDEYAEPTALENLVAEMKDGVGAVGGLVLDPKMSQKAPPGYMNHNKLADIKARENTQWVMHPPGRTMEVEHLYSSFLYRKVDGIGYCLELEKCAHREESLFSHEYVRKGMKLIVTTSAVTWHFRNPEGGIRSHAAHPEYWEHDEKIFERKLQSWQIDMEGKKLIIIDAGIGDSVCFMQILPELLKKYPNLVIGTYYPTLFKKHNVKTLHPWSAKDILGEKVAELQNVYRHLWKNKDAGRKLTLIEAYRELFLGEQECE